MKLQHKLTVKEKISTSLKGKPVYFIQCSCGKHYTGTYAESRQLKCSQVEKLPEKILYDSYEASAKARGYKMEISLCHFKFISQAHCAYCDAPPTKNIKGQLFNGIDRYDNTKDYTINNCITCCSTCNKMKGTLTIQEFVDKIKAINTNFIIATGK